MQRQSRSPYIKNRVIACLGKGNPPHANVTKKSTNEKKKYKKGKRRLRKLRHRDGGTDRYRHNAAGMCTMRKSQNTASPPEGVFRQPMQREVRAVGNGEAATLCRAPPRRRSRQARPSEERPPQNRPAQAWLRRRTSHKPRSWRQNHPYAATAR